MKSCPQEYMTVCQELEQILTKPHVTVSPYFVQILCHFILFKLHDMNCSGPAWNCWKPYSISSIVSWDICLNLITFCSSFMSRWHSMIRWLNGLNKRFCYQKDVQKRRCHVVINRQKIYGISWALYFLQWFARLYVILKM